MPEFDITERQQNYRTTSGPPMPVGHAGRVRECP